MKKLVNYQLKLMISKYENYKITGFEWLGEIPFNWNISRVAKYYNLRNEKVDDITFPSLSVTMFGIVDQLSHVAKSDDGENRKLVKKDDFVINSRSDRKGSSGISPRDGSVSLINIVLEPIKPSEVYPKFSQYLFKNYYFKEEFFRNGKGIHWDLWTTKWDYLKNINIPIPTIKEQKLISSYLDIKTHKIETLINKTQKKIKLLKELRISRINHYVTKGLEQRVDLKDIGVEWIGEIPNDWKVSRLDFLSSIKGRIGWKALKADEYVDDGYIFLSTPNISNKKIDFDNVNYITQERYNESPELKLKQEDVLLVKDGSTLGVTNFVRELPKEATVNSSIAILKVFYDKIVPEFLYWFVSGYFIQNIIQRIKGGMGVPHLFQSDIKKFLILLPSIQEQYKIINVLNEEVDKLDDSIQFEKNKIKLLKEYHQSLIYSVVTGKVRIMKDMV